MAYFRTYPENYLKCRKTYFTQIYVYSLRSLHLVIRYIFVVNYIYVRLSLCGDDKRTGRQRENIIDE